MTHTTNLNLNKPDLNDNVNVITDINDNMDIIDSAYDALNSNIESLMVSSGSYLEVQSIGTSGTYQSYTVPSDGFYTVRVSLGGGATSTCLARITIGNNVMFNIIASLAQYDSLQPTPLFFKKGTEIKGLAIFPSHGSANIVRVA